MHEILPDPAGEPYSTTITAGWAAIGASIRAARLRRGMTQTALGNRTGVHQSTISRLETGRLTGLRWSKFARIIGTLGDAWPPPTPWRPVESEVWRRLR